MFLVLFPLGALPVGAQDSQVSWMKLKRIDGELQLVAERLENEQDFGTTQRRSETTVFEEWLKLHSSGSVYHPNFLQFDGSLGMGLTQQQLDSDQESQRVSDTLEEYSLLVEMLRTKKVPMTFYTNRTRDIIARDFVGPLESEVENSGFTLGYRSESWPMRLAYGRSETVQDALGPSNRDFFARDDERLTYSLEHDFSKLSHMNFEYEHNEFSQKRFGASTDTETDRPTFLHDVIFGDEEQYRLDSYFSRLDQQGSFELENTQWQERLKARHTDTFSTFYELGVSDSKLDTNTNQEVRGTTGFEHRLYESLSTAGDIFKSQTDLGEEGDIDQEGGVLSFSYRKKNPLGTLLSTYAVNYITTDQTGGTGQENVIDERHFYRTIDPEPIELDRRLIDVSSIVVWDSTRTRRFFENLDYRVLVSNDKVFISVITGGDIFVGGDQTLSFDYRFTLEAQREEERLRQDFTIRQRFDNGVSVYYAHRRQDENISSSLGTLTPDEFRENTYGIDFSHKGLFLLAEYSQEDSTQISSTRKRTEASYTWPVNADTRAVLSASNYWIEYAPPDSRDLDLLNLGARITSRLTERTNLSGQMIYRNEDDSRFGPTEGFVWRSELQYQYRQLKVDLGVEFDFLNRTRQENQNTYIYCRVTRYF